MNEFKTIVEPAAVFCPRSLPVSRAHECEFALNIGLFFDGTDNNKNTEATKRINAHVVQRHLETMAAIGRRWKHRAVRLLGALSIAALLSACALHSNDLVPDQDKVGVSVSAVGHYGSMIGIPEYSIDDFHGGNNSGWGGGGSTACCVLLPRTVTKPVIVTVKWETCDISHIKFVNDRIVDPTERCILQEHEATVPIHFAVQPGEGGAGLFVHFLPGHKVEVWYPEMGPSGPGYPGPKYPFGPAPPYVPSPGEKPALPSDSNNKK